MPDNKQLDQIIEHTTTLANIGRAYRKRYQCHSVQFVVKQFEQKLTFSFDPDMIWLVKEEQTGIHRTTLCLNDLQLFENGNKTPLTKIFGLANYIRQTLDQIGHQHVKMFCQSHHNAEPRPMRAT